MAVANSCLDSGKRGVLSSIAVLKCTYFKSMLMQSQNVRGRRLLPLLIAALCAGRALAQSDFQGATHLMPFDEDTINYSKAPAGGPIARLQDRIDCGEIKLQFDEKFGYLPAVLKALNVSTTSQTLVFSKTSFQRERISPKTPRALFFNDDVYIGFIPGAPLMEVSAVDTKLGGVFYTLDQQKVEKPRFTRNDQCLECHASAKTMGVPGHLLRSFITDTEGIVDLNSGISLVNHRTPLADRWGGWYVTGQHGSQTHRGNLVGKVAFEREEREPNYLGNQTELSRFFDVGKYPARTSDIVALMVLEHQTHMHNFLTRLHYESTLALQQYGHVNYLKNIIEAFLRYLLFTEETPLTSPIKGSDEFARAFAEQGPKDQKGRSLRELDLRSRVFKYPCSYLIYSDAFDQLPEQLKTRIYERLWAILSGKDTNPDWQKLSSADRQAFREILVATKRGLPDYWNAADTSKQ
jgi:hypothetical protein